MLLITHRDTLLPAVENSPYLLVFFILPEFLVSALRHLLLQNLRSSLFSRELKSSPQNKHFELGLLFNINVYQHFIRILCYILAIVNKNWPYRLSVRTHPSQGWKRGSIPRKVTTVFIFNLFLSFVNKPYKTRGF